MSFIELAKKRYSCRKLSEKKVPAELVDKIIEAAIVSPTAKNMQPYKIWLMDSEDAKNAIKEVNQFIFGADTFLVLGADESISWVRPQDNKNFADIDAAIVGTQMMLAITDLGLATTWVGYFDAPRLKQIYPEMQKYNLIAIFPIGYEREDAKPAGLHNKRKSKEEVVTVL